MLGMETSIAAGSLENAWMREWRTAPVPLETPVTHNGNICQWNQAAVQQSGLYRNAPHKLPHVVRRRSKEDALYSIGKNSDD